MTTKPERTCIVCRTKGPKEKFLKVLKNKNGEFAIEGEVKLDGRGSYICKNQECIEKCKKTKALNRSFKTNVPSTIYEELKYENKY